MELGTAMTATLIPLMALAAGRTAEDSIGHWRVYVGTYTGGISEGIYSTEFDAETGALREATLAAAMENPSFLAMHPSLPVLYAVGESGADGGTVSAFRIEGEGGTLTPINRVSSVGGGPCHVAVSPSGRHAAVANYGGGSVIVFPLGDDGALGEASAFVQHEGKGPNPKRQEGPHAHGVYFDETGRHLFVVDLGLDKIMIYDFDDATGSLSPHDPPHASVDQGEGPRHMAFHPKGRFAYVVNEMGNTVTAFAYESASGGLHSIGTVPTLPESFSEENTTAEIAVHPNGRLLYASNRGHDSIATYEIDSSSGKLRVIGHTSTGGATPRHFAIDPSGKYLLAANQESDTIVVFRVNPSEGTLKSTGEEAVVGSPVCVVFDIR